MMKQLWRADTQQVWNELERMDVPGHRRLCRRRVLAALASPLLGAAGRVSAQSQSDSRAVKIGLSGPFSGGSAPMGLSMRNGVRLAVSELNAMGGMFGRPVALIERDDRANPALGSEIAQELIGLERVVASIGIVNTGVGLSSIDHYQRARIPIMVAVSTGTALTRKFAPPMADENFIFRVSPTSDMEAQVLSSELLRRGVRDVAILADATPYGESGKQDLEKWLAVRGIRITGIERFAIGTTDTRPQLTRLRAGKPQALLVWGIGPEMAQIARDRVALGWSVLFCGGWTFSMSNFLEGAGAAAEGTLMTQTFIQEGGLSNRNAFLLAYARLTNEERIASPMAAAQGYDGMHLLAAAMRQAGSTEGGAVRRALEDLRSPVPGVITEYIKPFSKYDHDAVSVRQMVVAVVNSGRVTYANTGDARRGLLARNKDVGSKNF